MNKPYPWLILIVLLFSTSVSLAQKRRKADSVTVTIRFTRPFLSNRTVDSVLVFFDRTNHTGAGIIKQVFHPKNNEIIIHKVPEGRYFIGILCMGMYQKFFSDITFINKARSNDLKFKLPHSDPYLPGLAYIPPVSAMNLHKLIITNGRSFK